MGLRSVNLPYREKTEKTFQHPRALAVRLKFAPAPRPESAWRRLRRVDALLLGVLDSGEAWRVFHRDPVTLPWVRRGTVGPVGPESELGGRDRHYPELMRERSARAPAVEIPQQSRIDAGEGRVSLFFFSGGAFWS